MSKNQWEDRLAEREKNQRWLEDRFYDLDYPGLYLGDEMNTFHFDWDRAIRENRIGEHFRIALMNLCTSQLTFAAPAVMLFYEQLHAYDASWVVERSFCPPQRITKNGSDLTRIKSSLQFCRKLCKVIQ